MEAGLNLHISLTAISADNSISCEAREGTLGLHRNGEERVLLSSPQPRCVQLLPTDSRKSVGIQCTEHCSIYHRSATVYIPTVVANLSCDRQ